MFCPNCGARNSEADTTCQKCGFNLKEATGAKFKGTMLMMNNPAAADLRRSGPPGGNAPPAVNVPPGTAKPQPTAPDAQQMRAKLKGTMIGVAPPAAAINQPLPTATPAVRQPSVPPTAGQPGAGQVNAPGAGLHRGGTMIGTGIGNQYPVPGDYGTPARAAGPEVSPPNVPQQDSPSAPQAFGATHGGGALVQGPAHTGAATVRSVESNPLAQTQVAAGAPEPYQNPVAAPQVAASYPQPDATRAMSQFDQAPPQRPISTLDGTMVAGGIPTPPRTDSMPHVGPQFSEQAGNRTDTPPMGFPAAGQSYTPGSAGGQSKGKTLLLTVLTCGLYRLFKKTK